MRGWLAEDGVANMLELWHNCWTPVELACSWPTWQVRAETEHIFSRLSVVSCELNLVITLVPAIVAELLSSESGTEA